LRPGDAARAEIARLLAETAADQESAEARRRELEVLLASGGAWRDGSAKLSVAALALHHYYTSVESFIERVGRTFEGRLPADGDWHRALLRGATLHLDGVRPRVIRPETERCLVDLLRFRHFLRHAYSASLDPVRLRELAELAVTCAGRVKDDLDAFRDHLHRAAAALDED